MKRLILVGLLACASAAHAEFYTGNDLLRMMRGNNAEQAAAFGYVVGVSDALHKITLCVPNGVTVGQVNDVVLLWLDRNPQSRHFSADSMVVAALSPIWGCKKGTGV